MNFSWKGLGKIVLGLAVGTVDAAAPKLKIGELVEHVQDLAVPGADKHRLVRETAIAALPLVEGLVGIDLTQAKGQLESLFDGLIEDEVQLRNILARIQQRRAEYDALVATFKAAPKAEQV